MPELDLEALRNRPVQVMGRSGREVEVVFLHPWERDEIIKELDALAELRKAAQQNKENLWATCEDCGKAIDPVEVEVCEGCGVLFHSVCLSNHELECIG